jgi:hypothetical protein
MSPADLLLLLSRLQAFGCSVGACRGHNVWVGHTNVMVNAEVLKRSQPTVGWGCSRLSRQRIEDDSDFELKFELIISIMNCSLFQDIFQNTTYRDRLLFVMDGLESAELRRPSLARWLRRRMPKPKERQSNKPTLGCA